MCFFFIGTGKAKQSPSSHNNPDTRKCQLCCSDNSLPPSVTIESPQNTPIYYYKSISVYTVDSLPQCEKPSSYTQIHSCYYYQDLHISPLHTRSRKALQQNNIALLLNIVKKFSYQNYIPSIFSNVRFGRYVVTRFLADANFHGHRPTVTIKPSDSYYLLLDYLS